MEKIIIQVYLMNSRRMHLMWMECVRMIEEDFYEPCRSFILMLLPDFYSRPFSLLARVATSAVE